MLNPEVYDNIESIRDELSGPFAVIRNALKPELAEALYASLRDCKGLEAEDESLFEGKTDAGYTYNRLSLDMASELAPPAVRELNSYLNSSAALELVRQLSNRTCNRFFGKIAAYRPGHYIKSHNDLYLETRANRTVLTRSVTFNYFLTREWDPDWGGQFVWENPRSTMYPEFNTLVMFLVGPDSNHYVTPVMPNAGSLRLALTGWFVSTRQADNYLRTLNFDFL